MRKRTEHDTWIMDLAALKKVFEIYPDVKMIVTTHLYGNPNCHKTRKFGNVSVVSMNGNEIITNRSGGMPLTDHLKWANKAKKWAIKK